MEIAIVADFNGSSKSHLATNAALADAGAALGREVTGKWIGTEEVAKTEAVKVLRSYEGIWIGPGSPYRSMEGALGSIRLAREERIPLLGTCGGFQHIIIEQARNVLGLDTADHEESAPEASPLVISRLACSLAGRTMQLKLNPLSRLAGIYKSEIIEEEYLCNFGVNPAYVDALRKSPLKISASDDEGEIRAVELTDHPFFVGTLFLPQHRSSATRPHPLVLAFVEAALQQRDSGKEASKRN